MINVGLTKQLNVHANNDLIDMLPIKYLNLDWLWHWICFFMTNLSNYIIYLTRCSRIYITMSNYLCGLAIFFLNVYKNKSSRNFVLLTVLVMRHVTTLALVTARQCSGKLSPTNYATFSGALSLSIVKGVILISCLVTL